MASDRLHRTTPSEWAISAIGHAVVFALLVWFTPVRQLILPTSAPPPPPSPDLASADTFSQLAASDPERVEEVVKAIQEKQTENAAATATQLLDSEKQIDGMVKPRLAALQQQDMEIAKEAPQAARDQLKAITQNQADAVAAQQQLTAKVQDLAAKALAAKQAADATALQQTATDLAQARKDAELIQASVKQDQIAAQDGQEKAADLLKFVPPTLADNAATQDAATAAQSTAVASQRQASNHASSVAQKLAFALTAARQALDAQAPVTPAQTAADQLKQQAMDFARKVDEANAQVQESNRAAQEAKAVAQHSKTLASHDPTQAAPARTDQDIAQGAQDAADAARADLDAARRASGQAQREALDAQHHFDQVRGNATHLQQRADGAFAAAGDPATLNADQQKANQDQATAQKTQADALAKLDTAITQTPGGTNSTPVAIPMPTPAPDASMLNGKNLGQLYEAARGTEGRITDKYKMFRAAELASIRKITFQEALQDTEVARPNRENIDTKLLASDGKNIDLAAYKAEVMKADQQLASMNALSADMLSSMQSEGQQPGSDAIDVSNWLKAQGEQAEQQQVAATANDDNAVGKDLTGAGGGGGGGGGSGGKGSASGSTTGDGDDQGMIDPAAQRVYPRHAPELPNMDYKNIKPYATRRIGTGGPHYADWLYVDSWYLIGPFPNEGRRNLYTKFPPESIVDLNATYTGKNNQPIRWHYRQWDGPEIRIPDDIKEAPAIYYAYTEVFFDEPHDLWIASGSDDKGVMWLNDVMVWNSGDNLKSWRPDEGYRKVHFQKGVNRILYRLENGQFIAALSLMISMKTAATTP